MGHSKTSAGHFSPVIVVVVAALEIFIYGPQGNYSSTRSEKREREPCVVPFFFFFYNTLIDIISSGRVARR